MEDDFEYVPIPILTYEECRALHGLGPCDDEVRAVIAREAATEHELRSRFDKVIAAATDLLPSARAGA
jgi:hypothetical protein